MRFVLSHASHIERMSFRTRVILHVVRDILRSCAVTSEKAGTSLTESLEKKGIRVERYSNKHPSAAKIHHYHWNHKYSFVAKIHHYLKAGFHMIADRNKVCDRLRSCDRRRSQKIEP